MLTPKIYDWHLKHNWGCKGMVKSIMKAKKDLEPLSPCECGCNVGLEEKGGYYCMHCKKTIIIG